MKGKRVIKQILISQPKPADLCKTPYGELIKKYDLEIDFHKFIHIKGLTASEFRAFRINLEKFSAIVLSGRNAVDHFFRMSKDMRYKIPEKLKYFCLSEHTALYLQKYVPYRKRKIFYANGSFENLISMIKENREETFLMPCSDNYESNISKQLKKEKILFKEAVMYKTVPSDLKFLDMNKYDMVVFFSPQDVESLQSNFPDFKLDDLVIAGYGKKTNKAITDNGLKGQISVPTKACPSMTMAIETYLTENKTK